MHCLRLKNGAIISFATAADLIRFVKSSGDDELKKAKGLEKKTRPDLRVVKPAGRKKSDDNPKPG